MSAIFNFNQLEALLGELGFELLPHCAKNVAVQPSLAPNRCQHSTCAYPQLKRVGMHPLSPGRRRATCGVYHTVRRLRNIPSFADWGRELEGQYGQVSGLCRAPPVGMEVSLAYGTCGGKGNVGWGYATLYQEQTVGFPKV